MTALLPALVGIVGIALALVVRGSPLGGIAWLAAAIVASTGFGNALARVTGVPCSAGVRHAVGLAAMICVATVLAQLGVLSEWIVFGVVAIGVVATGVPQRPAPSRNGLDAFAIGTMAFAVGLGMTLAFVREATLVTDGINHTLEVKRLYDLGAVDAWNRVGAGLVGEAIFAWGIGAEAAGLFDAWCASLVVVVIASELAGSRDATQEVAAAAGRRDLLGKLVLAVSAAVIVLEPTMPDESPAVLFHLVAILALRGLPGGAAAGASVVAALALGMIRHELWFLALPYIACALLLPRFASPARRHLVVVGMVGWIGALFGLQLLLGIGAGNAVAKAVMMTSAIPLAILLVRLLGVPDLKTELGVACFACATFLLALATYAIHPARHALGATTATWFGMVFALLVALVRTDRSGSLHLGAIAIAVAIFVTDALLLPNFVPAKTERISRTFTLAPLALRERLVLGVPDHDRIAALQHHTPAGARLGFWGRSAARLDFQRNPIRDLSSRSRRALRMIQARSADEVDFLLIEDIPAYVYDARGRVLDFEPALGDIADRVELVASDGIAKLYRVRK